MKNKIFYPIVFSLFILFLGALHSCGPSKEEVEAMEKAKQEAVRKTPSGTLKLNDNEVKIYEFHDCQYMVVDGGYSYAWGAHMGDCDNPIHKANGN